MKQKTDTFFNVLFSYFGKRKVHSKRGEGNPTNTPCPKSSQQLSIPPKFYASFVSSLEGQDACRLWLSKITGFAPSISAQDGERLVKGSTV